MKPKCALGIDTSNYKTSVAAVTESGKIVSDRRIFLNVKEGALGLRQSEALFQHTVNLPGLLEEVMGDVRTAGCQLGIVAASAAPRPQAGSYMPAFLAGMGAGRAAAAAAGCRYLEFSHQEGHIMAVKYYSPLSDASSHISMHLSGGTTELLYVDDDENSMNIEICGGSHDISFGQLLDRTGQLLGFDFPAGEEIDRLALRFAETTVRNDLASVSAIRNTTGNEICTVSIPEVNLPQIKVNDGWINLSGIETAVKRYIEAGCGRGELALELMKVISGAIVKMAEFGCKKYGVRDVLLAGGVSSSDFVRRAVREYMQTDNTDMNIVFGEPKLSSDNAVGTALLGMRKVKM